MPTTQPTQITSLPTPPIKGQSGFNAACETYFNALVNPFTGEVNAIANNAYGNAVVAQSSANIANNALAASGAQMWASGEATSLGQMRISGISFQAFRRVVSGGTNTIDPFNDQVNWKRVSFIDNFSESVSYLGFYQLNPSHTFVKLTYTGGYGFGVKLPDSRYTDVCKTITIKNENKYIHAQIFNYEGVHIGYIAPNESVDVILGSSTSGGGGEWVGSNNMQYVATVAYYYSVRSGVIPDSIIRHADLTNERKLVAIKYAGVGVYLVAWDSSNDTFSSDYFVPNSLNYQSFVIDSIFDKSSAIIAFKQSNGTNSVCTISINGSGQGASIVSGVQYTYTSANNPVRIIALSATSAAIVNNSANETGCDVVALQISGSTITVSTAFAISTAMLSLSASFFIPPAYPNSFFIVGRNNIITNCQIILATVSGLSVSVSNSIQLASASPAPKTFELIGNGVITADSAAGTVKYVSITNTSTIVLNTSGAITSTNEIETIVNNAYGGVSLIGCNYSINLTLVNNVPTLNSYIGTTWIPLNYRFILNKNGVVTFVASGVTTNPYFRYVVFQVSTSSQQIWARNLYDSEQYQVANFETIFSNNSNCFDFFVNSKNLMYSFNLSNVSSTRVFDFTSYISTSSIPSKIGLFSNMNVQDYFYRFGKSKNSNKVDDLSSDMICIEKYTGAIYFVECIS